jgi:hypothetical protein
MKNYTLIVTVITAALIRVCLCQSPSPSPTASFTVCQQSSRDVEVYGFYGSKEIVLERVGNVPVNVSERRLFLQITQSGRTVGAKIDVKLFEKQQDGSKFAITEWKNVKAPGLFDDIDRAITENKGKHCVGDAIKDVLKKLGTGTPVTPLSVPTSPKDAFGPSVQDISDDFGKSIIILGC